jgi:hypothetical protein
MIFIIECRIKCNSNIGVSSSAVWYYRNAPPRKSAIEIMAASSSVMTGVVKSGDYRPMIMKLRVLTLILFFISILLFNCQLLGRSKIDVHWR